MARTTRKKSARKAEPAAGKSSGKTGGGQPTKDDLLKYKLTADRIAWDSTDQRWILENYMIRQIDSLHEKITKGDKMDTVINLKPSDLYVRKELYEEMNFRQLRDYIADEKMKGSEDVIVYEVEKHTRVSSPFATLVLTLIGVTLSSRKIRGGIGMHLGLGILITFAFIDRRPYPSGTADYCLLYMS